MTLYTTDYLEYYLTLVAWVVNNGIWSILVASGVFALPFVAIVIQEWLKARSEGADEGNKGVLSSMRIGHQRAVHASELGFVVKISARTQAPHHNLGTPRPHEVAHQPVKTFHLHLRVRRHRLARHVHTFFQAEKCLLVRRC